MAHTEPADGSGGRRASSAVGWAAWGLLMAGVAVAWAVPDAPARLRAWWRPVAAMPADCVLSAGPCTATFADGAQVTLSVEPPDAPADAPVTFTLRGAGVGAPTGVTVQGVDMYMGVFAPPLVAQGDAHVATMTLPFCTTDAMRWRLDALYEGRTAVFEIVSVAP